MVSMHTSPTDAPGAGDAGGMNVVEHHEALTLAGLGHRVDVVTRRSSQGQPDSVALAPGVMLHHLEAGPARTLAKSATDQYIPQFAAALGQLGRRLADEAPVDLVHSHHWMSGVAALPLARAWGVPHVQSYHSVAAPPGSQLSDGEPPESPDRVPGEALLARESDLLVAISAAEARIVVERCGADPHRVSIVPPGVDLELFHPQGPREAPAWTAEVQLDRPFAVVAGRLQPLKAPDLAIRALAHVPEEVRPALVVAGAASADFADYEAYLRRLADEAGLGASVHMVGPQSRTELAWLFAHGLLTLVPSHSETFGLVALESAACGTPVVAAASGGLREAVVHGETGQLMDSRQPEDWGLAITKLVTRPQALGWMGTVARVHARRFTWTATVTELLRLYDQLIQHSTLVRPAEPIDHSAKNSLPRPETNEPGEPIENVEHSTHAWPTPQTNGPVQTTEPGGGRRYVFVHAHPDDETLSSGAAILALRRQGDEVVVVTATRGERGETTASTAADQLVAVRVGERAQALACLGAVDGGFLGDVDGQATRRYTDSGMIWLDATTAGPDPHAPADAFCLADLDDVVADIVAAAYHWDADVLVSYDASGGYGHPDHIRCHEATVRAADQLGVAFQWLASGDCQTLEAGPDLDRLVAAHRSYPSQLTVSDDDMTLTHVGGQIATIATSTCLCAADPADLYAPHM